MLTGDKLETAENIGRSCSLIQPDFSILRINFPPQTSEDEIKDDLIEVHEVARLSLANNKKKALLIEGTPLASILANEILKDIFLDIIEKCETVICCRMTPKQKAEVVKLVKDYLGKITLAVGDGANDVNMIQEAHIGIGIFGVEGMRAVQVSDFAIGEFRFLWKLVLVQGRWCYLRISEMILYFFYKNMAFTVIQFYYSFVCAYSGQSIYDDSYIVFFNLIFTSLPLMVRAIMEKDVYYMVQANKYEKGERLMKEVEILKKIYPKFYYKGQQNKLFNKVRYFNWVMQGLCHGAIIFGFCLIVFYYSVLNIGGYTNDIWVFSVFLYSCLIMVVDIKLASYTQSWTILFIATIVLTSMIFYFSYIFIASEISSLQVYETSYMLYQSPSFYFLMFLTVGIVFLVDLLVIYLKQNYKSGNVEKGRSLMKQRNYYDEKTVEQMFESARKETKKRDEELPIISFTQVEQGG